MVTGHPVGAAGLISSGWDPRIPGHWLFAARELGLRLVTSRPAAGSRRASEPSKAWAEPSRRSRRPEGVLDPAVPAAPRDAEQADLCSRHSPRPNPAGHAESICAGRDSRPCTKGCARGRILSGSSALAFSWRPGGGRILGRGDLRCLRRWRRDRCSSGTCGWPGQGRCAGSLGGAHRPPSGRQSGPGPAAVRFFTGGCPLRIIRIL